jgi:dihydrofolate reductase
MPKFILYIATSLDGYIARSDGSIDWLMPPEEVDKDEDYLKFYSSVDALVMGSTTYEQILGFGDWPYPEKLSYVLTHRKLSTERKDIVFMEDVKSIVKDTQRREYQRVWLVGGGKAVAPFLTEKLVDEYFIFVVPIILGSGISLYKTASELDLKLVDTKSHSHGIVELHYEKK